MECVCCFGFKSKLLPLTDVHWADIVTAANKWILYARETKITAIARRNSKLWILPYEQIDKTKYGYHNNCRTNFTNKRKLQDAEKIYEKYLLSFDTDVEGSGLAESTGESCEPSPAKTRRHTSVRSRSSTSGVLEHKCIVCGKSGELIFWDSVVKLSRHQPLSRCELSDAGMFFLIFIISI
jgi:hypothetical protein